MRHLKGAAVAAAVALLALSAPALAAAAQNPDKDWKVVIYPIYGWLPINRATTRLPEVPGDDGPVVPEGETDSGLDQAILAAFRVEKGRFSLEGGFLYAGLSGDKELPLVKLEVDTSLADLRAGFEVVPDLYLEAGARYLALDMKATIGDYPTREWKPDQWGGVFGLTYRPLLGKNWRLILHGDYGGVGTDSYSIAGVAKVEWQPLKHFLLVGGVTAIYLNTEGTIGNKSVELEQTLYGPIIGFGIPF